jgi:uncharacterized damage-inducible protein DinB
MTVFTNRAAAATDEAAAYTRALLELLGDEDPLEVLERGPSALDDAVRGLKPDQLQRPETRGKWSATDVLQHLADSEAVWAVRLRKVLAEDRPKIEGYDQDLWADRLHYADADPVRARRVFRVLREANLGLVRGLSASERSRTGVHSDRGPESVEHMIRLYAAHDLVHLQQLARIRKKVG